MSTSSNPFAKVTKGQQLSISAAAWNPLMDVAAREVGRSGRGGSGPAGFGRDVCIVRVFNNSGADVDRFAVLGIDTAAITPTDNPIDFLNYPVLSGVLPLDPDHIGLFVITAEPITAGKIGNAVITGMVPVQINMLVSGDLWADVLDSDSTQLQSGPMGSAQIIYVESGTGTKWAWVRVGSPPHANNNPFMVLVKSNGGSNGDASTVASWTYDLYDLADTSYVTKLNLSGPLSPEISAARIVEGTVTKAADGSRGQAYFATDGTIQLYICGETRVKKVCTDGGG